MAKFTLGTCSFNTPEITLTMLRSFRSVCSAPILVCDNSTDDRTEIELKDNCIPYIRNVGMGHPAGVEQLMQNISTRYMLLADTDVIFHKDPTDLLEYIDECAILGNISGGRGGKWLLPRVDPWFCLIDIETVKAEGIHFYDPNRDTGMTRFGEFDPNNVAPRYDVGSSFLEDLGAAKLYANNIDLSGAYYSHYEALSWGQNSGNEKIRGNTKTRFDIYLDEEVPRFANVDLRGES